MKLSLNETVTVRLTPAGLAYLRGQEHSRHRLLPPGARYVHPVAEDGTTRFQLWNLMHVFGDKMGLALPEMFSPLEIEFKREQCHDVDPVPEPEEITVDALLAVGYVERDGKLIWDYGKHKGEYLYCYHDPRDNSIAGFFDGHNTDRIFPHPLNVNDLKTAMDNVKRYYARS